MQKSTYKMPKSASQAVLSKMQLTLFIRATRRIPHRAPRLVQAISICPMVGEKSPTCSVPAL